MFRCVHQFYPLSILRKICLLGSLCNYLIDTNELQKGGSAKWRSRFVPKTFVEFKYDHPSTIQKAGTSVFGLLNAML